MTALPSSKQKILDRATWNAIRPGLNSNYVINDEWVEVISLFRKRIEDFYLNPIAKITEPKKLNGEGFSIVTLQCVLIEMFAAFKYGEIHNRRKPRVGGLSFEYNFSSECFIKWLHEEEIFRDHFFIVDTTGNKTIDQPYNAEEFYDRVRCGLMHEARTKVDWRIIASASKAPAGSLFITTDTDGTKIIHRTKLFDALKNYFENIFLQQLSSANANGERLRRFLARKLDHLHDIARDVNFEWWQDP